MQETRVSSLGREDPLEMEMATHSSILAWRIPWTDEPGGLQAVGSWRVGHDWATSLYIKHQRHAIKQRIDKLNFFENKIFCSKEDINYMRMKWQATDWVKKIAKIYLIKDYYKTIQRTLEIQQEDNK